ncbi:Piezo-type mechanosensitive ion channel component [Gryllus bimaculatus]|nr:Piezo-type mechanosensitive ion channel component [Gryllus bimaculatus]
MATTALGILLLRLVLPICLTACVVFRQNLLSFIYLLLFFYAPWVGVPSAKSMQGATGWYLQIVMICSFLTSMAQLSFQIVLLSMPPYGHFLEPCEFLERVLRHIGLVRLDGIGWVDAVRTLTPEALMLFVSVIVYVVCTNAVGGRRRLSEASAGSLPSTAAILPSNTAIHKKEQSTSQFVMTCGKYVVLISLCAAGSMRPSVPGGVYFLTFIGGMTWWASGRALGRAFGGMLYIIICISVLHIIALFGVQLQWVQDLIGEGDCNYCRYLGLTRLAITNCTTDPRSITYESAEWASYVNPFILLWLYFIVTLEARILIKKHECDLDGVLQTESTPLMRGVSPTGNYSTTANHAAAGLDAGPGSLYQDPHGSVTITEVNDIVQMESLGDAKESPEESSGDLFDQLVSCITSVMTILNRSSYIATNIVMMAWSITYHSWLTFVLLLWASVLWMFPNQRQASLNSSPVLVLYAICLLLIQYIYGMDLTDAELPQELQNINLQQIGFFKPLELPCKPLFAKSLYTVMFWITLRQFVYERFQRKTRHTLEDMAAPLQVTVTTATTGFGDSSSQKPTPLVTKLGEIVIHFLTKFWIWVVAIMLFVIGMSGKNMTIFRIIYTALFLLFVLVFQLSYAAWRKFLYGFWITVIIYSLAILVMVYTYQFDNFDTYWARMGISETLQEDIGLEKFQTGDLFVRLLIPTFFLVITVIQLHYFHRDFLALSDINARNETSNGERPEESTLPIDIEDTGPESGQFEKKHSFLRTMHRHMSHEEIERAWKRMKDRIEKCIDYIWLYLEIHMYKIMLLSIVLLCVRDVCAVHFILLLMAVVALSFGTRIHSLITKICSALVSVFLLSKMIYQIQYIKPDIHDVNCTFSVLGTNITNYTFNNLQWVGLDKTNDELSLPELVKGYIGLIFLATILAVIIIRQQYRRQKMNLPLKRPEVLFPDINRNNADRNLKSGIQFLVNYGFYKFGIEICYILAVILIASRMDMYALLHCIWLCGLFSLERETLARIWGFYHIFIALTICIQYAFAVGLPTAMCIEYPWYTSETLRHVQDWAFLPDPLYPLPVYKIVADFILLILVSQQGVVFYLEKKHGADYNGGSNQDITHLIDDPHYANPIPDFISIARSWLDIVKQRVLCTLMWVTLAVMFLAGTNRVSLFSLGYLIGAFVFLWQGEDFYLRSVKVILHWWNYLLGYNVAVISCKTLLQIVGCIFLKETKQSACTVVQLFAISCIKRAGETDPNDADEDECAVSDEVIGLFWDTMCFVFLIAMRRVFKSHYFIHIVNETKAKTILASRGAELIEQLHLDQIKAQEDQEHTMLEKIKQKMEKIKASQQKMQDTYREPSNHFEAGKSAMKPYKPPKFNRDAIRSGDYYMFEELEDEVCDLEEKEEDESGDENDPLYPSGKRKMSMSQFLTSALKTDLKKATDLALAGQSPQASDGSTGLGPLPESVCSPQERAAFFHARSEPCDAPLSHSSTSTRSERHPVYGVGDPLSGQGPEKRPDEGEGPSDQKSLGPEEEDEKSPNIWHKIATFLKFAWAFVESAMVSMTIYLNRFSRDYRYVRKVLTVEKKMLKEKPGFGRGIRSGSGMIWEPPPGATASPSHLPSVDEIDQRDFMKQSDTPAFIYLVQAMWFAFIAHTDSVCYFMVFLHQVSEPTILSLPLPLMVFLWGTLSVPRPTKTFWVTMIAYTEVIVVIKCMFQFELLPWHEESLSEKSPFFPPRILGIERDPHYAVYDLVLLLIIFLHRFMLKSMGLWKSTNEDEIQLEEGEHYFMMEEGLESNTLPSSHTENMDTTEEGNNLRHRFGSQRSRIATRAGRQLLMVEQPAEEGDEQSPPAEVSESGGQLVVVKAQAQSLCQHFPKAFSMMTSKYGESVKIFFKDLLSPSKKVKADVYAYMFMCDFFNFLVIIFGFAAFGPQREDDGGVLSYLEENKVPIPFLIMLILQFALIVIDRALFLRKYILGKLVFQFCLVVGVHIWLFFVLPGVTERSFREALTPQMWYMVKCFYLLLSAYQIRSGYPTRILGNFVCKRYNIINMVLFKGFMFVPFLFELRALMDWVWTDTSMTLWDWLKMEDIFAHIFGLKCERRMEQEYPQPRGQKKAALVKYIMGGSFLFLIIGIIWFPLVIFALGNTVGMPNLPHDMSMTLSISSYPPLYSVSVQSPSITKGAQTFFSNYDYEDVAVAKFSHNASNIWTISPPDRLRLIDEIQSNKEIIFQLSWNLVRKSASKSSTGKASDSSKWIMDKTHETERKEFIKIIKMDANATNITIGHLFPKFLKFTNRDTVHPVPQLMKGDTEEEKSLRKLTLRLYRGSFLDTGITEEWWGISELCGGENFDILKHLPQYSCDHLVMYVFNDKAFPETLSIISGGGIMFTEVPCVDHILQLCLDIYLVRESGELALEEDLFAKLIFLYRSPETMIKWTRPRADDEADVEEESVAHPAPQQ